ncbi:MAG: hypothetical protein IT204_24945 [Fimbriimonadaceae bacterium]|nr:hypothetical protein [Fimbriimonadaceae bacterium]
MRHLRLLLTVGLLGLSGCRPTGDAPTAAPPAAESPAAAAPAATAPTTSAPPAPAPAAASAAPAAAPTAPAATAPAAVAGPALEGVQLNPKNGVRLLLPDGWEQVDSDDGSLLQLVRRESVGGVRVNLTFDYSVDEKVAPGTTLDAIEPDFAARFAAALPERKVTVLGVKRVTVAGEQALAVRADLDSEGGPLRLKQFVILADGTFWTLSAVGPRAQFDKVVEPELNAIAATLELPAG